MSYIPSGQAERKKMLDSLGIASCDGLFQDIPRNLRFDGDYVSVSSKGLSEFEIKERISATAAKNKAYKAVFRGAGAYNHYIPSVVRHLASRDEFVTAYTPYQPEISQGILQAIFEFQTIICNLTGMDVSNASVYDGATAAAEAVSMCLERGRRAVIVSECVNPGTLAVLKTYCNAYSAEIITAPQKDGITDINALCSLTGGNTACLYAETPNFYGLIEDGEALAAAARSKGTKFIAGVNPISLAVLKTPAEYGADIAVGEGQPLGLPLSFGGPYLGFMACKKELMRKMPGRIVGQTADKDGNRAYVLTLQAREQHIRREKALSNICSNQAHCALTAAIYCAAMGPQGLREVALRCMANAAYLKDKLAGAGFKSVCGGDIFHEFVTESPVPASKILAALDKKGILGGLEFGGNRILWCATECNGKEQIDGAIEIIKGALKNA